MKALSLFSGCGGMDLGFKKEGFDMVWAIDSDKDACETYRKNIGEHIVNQDIVKINFNDVPNCDIILGGFPCQDFSVIWKQPGLNGRRGDLYRHFIRAVVAKKPKAFVAENVRGLLSANGGKAYEKIIRDFASIGYTLYPNVYNFADYGVPQVRHRLIIVGINNKINNQFTIPLATHGKNAKLQHVSVRKCFWFFCYNCSYEMTIKITTASIKTRLFPYDRKILTWKPSKYDITIWNIIKINFDYVLIYYMFSYVFSISFACIFIRIDRPHHIKSFFFKTQIHTTTSRK